MNLLTTLTLKCGIKQINQSHRTAAALTIQLSHVKTISPQIFLEKHWGYIYPAEFVGIKKVRRALIQNFYSILK